LKYSDIDINFLQLKINLRSYKVGMLKSTMSARPILAVEHSMFTQGFPPSVISGIPAQQVHLIPITFQEWIQLSSKCSTASIFTVSNDLLSQPCSEQKEVKVENPPKKQALKKVNLLKSGRKKKIIKTKPSVLKTDKNSRDAVESAYEKTIFNCLKLKSQLGETSMFQECWMTAVNPADGNLFSSNQAKKFDVEMMPTYPSLTNEEYRSEGFCYKSDHLLADSSAKYSLLTEETSQVDQTSCSNSDHSYPRSIFNFELSDEEVMSTQGWFRCFIHEQKYFPRSLCVLYTVKV